MLSQSEKTSSIPFHSTPFDSIPLYSTKLRVWRHKCENTQQGRLIFLYYSENKKG